MPEILQGEWNQEKKNLARTEWEESGKKIEPSMPPREVGMLRKGEETTNR